MLQARISTSHTARCRNMKQIALDCVVCKFRFQHLALSNSWSLSVQSQWDSFGLLSWCFSVQLMKRNVGKMLGYARCTARHKLDVKSAGIKQHVSYSFLMAIASLSHSRASGERTWECVLDFTPAIVGLPDYETDNMPSPRWAGISHWVRAK